MISWFREGWGLLSSPTKLLFGLMFGGTLVIGAAELLS